jgi:cell division septation protein DedD
MEQGQQWKWDKENLTDPSSIAKNILPGVKNYVRDEMLGFDDFGNAAKHAKSGNVLGAIKSGLAGAAELALTVGTAGIGTGAKAAAKPIVKEAVTRATGAAAAQGVKKAEASAAKGPKFFDDPYTPKVGGATTSGYPRTGGTSSGPARGGSTGRSSSAPDAYTTGGAGTKTKPKTQTPWAPEYSPVKAEPLPKLLPKPKTSVKPSAKPSLKPAVKPAVKPETKVETKTKTETKTETKPKETQKVKEDAKKSNVKKNPKKIIPIIPALTPKGDGPWTPSAIV